MRTLGFCLIAGLLSTPIYASEHGKWTLLEKTDRISDQVTAGAIILTNVGQVSGRMGAFAAGISVTCRNSAPSVIVYFDPRFTFDAAQNLEYRFDAGDGMSIAHEPAQGDRYAARIKYPWDARVFINGALTSDALYIRARSSSGIAEADFKVSSGIEDVQKLLEQCAKEP